MIPIRRSLGWLALLPGLGLFIYLLFSHAAVQNEHLALPGEGVLVLCYHRVAAASPLLKLLAASPVRYPGDEELRYYTVLSDEFAAHMKHMIAHGAYFATPAELADYIHGRRKLPPKSVLITFDDVDVSVYENAYPLLLAEGIPFTLFIISGHVGNPRFKGLHLCSWEQIAEMMGSGPATVGLHSHSFHRLDKYNNPPFLDPRNNPAFAADTALGIQSLEENLGFTPRYYSYPYGYGTPDTDKILQEAGFELIFSLNPGTVRPGDPTFFVNRVLVTRATWPEIAAWFERR